MSLSIALALAPCLQDPVRLDSAALQDAGRTPAAAFPEQTAQALLDVEDLLLLHDDFPLEDKKTPPESRKERLRKATADFAELMKRWMQPAFAPAADYLDVVAPGHLSLVAGVAKIDWAQRFCSLQRSRLELVDVEIRILELPRGTLVAAGIDGPTKVLDKPPELDALLTGMKDRFKASLLLAPKLRAYPRQQVSMTVGDRVSYIADWSMEEVEPGPQTIAVPKIETVFDGTNVECCAVPLEADLYGLELKFKESKLERPIPTRRIRIGKRETKEVEIGLPKLDSVSLDTRVSLADGASVVFASMKTNEDRDLAVVVTLRRAPSEPRQR